MSPELLEQLHEKIRAHSCEGALWNAVLWYLALPLPLFIAHDLIDRGVSCSAMCFTRQMDEIQWRLATLDENALYTLIAERYTKPEFSVAQFETMLQLYTMRDDSILYILSCIATPSPEKETVFLAAVADAKVEERVRSRGQKPKQSWIPWKKKTPAVPVYPQPFCNDVFKTGFR